MRYSSLPLEQLHSWAALNGCTLEGIKVESHILTPDGVDKGGGLRATSNHEAHDVLLSVPSDLVLTSERVEQCAKTDRHLRELLQAMQSFAQTPRGSIMLFLAYQITLSAFNTAGIGVITPLTDYVKFLPKTIMLPTLYTLEEQELLVGTSLDSALKHKLSSLDAEFAMLRETTSTIGWCQKVWWSEDRDTFSLQDWKLVDALYRSRGLELPRDLGIAMCPFLDMANHASGDLYNSRFEIDDTGNALLITRDDRELAKNQEVLIRYGIGGACEMIFSYGFLDFQLMSAREMFLDLKIPEDDPLRFAKMQCAHEVPGVRIFIDENSSVRWESGYVWWACVNQEDGLDFRVLQTLEDERELKAVWRENEFATADLKALLMADELKDIFMLRAVVIIQSRLETQGAQLTQSETSFQTAQNATGISSDVWATIARLRQLELELLERAYEALEDLKVELMESEVVKKFLPQQFENQFEISEIEDFS